MSRNVFSLAPLFYCGWGEKIAIFATCSTELNRNTPWIKKHVIKVSKTELFFWPAGQDLDSWIYLRISENPGR